MPNSIINMTKKRVNVKDAERHFFSAVLLLAHNRAKWQDGFMDKSGEFPSRLRSMRGRAMMGQEELALKIGVSVDTVRRWESGSREPRLANLYALAENLGVTLAELLEESGRGSVNDSESSGEMIVFEWSDGAGGHMRVVLPPTPETYEFLERRMTTLSSGEQSPGSSRGKGGGMASAC